MDWDELDNEGKPNLVQKKKPHIGILLGRRRKTQKKRMMMMTGTEEWESWSLPILSAANYGH